MDLKERERERLVALPVAAFSLSLAGSRPAIFLYLVVFPTLWLPYPAAESEEAAEIQGGRKEKEPTLPTTHRRLRKQIPSFSLIYSR